MSLFQHQQRPRERLRAVAFICVLAAVVAGSAALTAALYTDQQDINGNLFSTGTVHLTTNPTSAALTIPGMMPGDKVTTPITVSNAGSQDLRYAVLSTTTEDTLAGGMQLAIKSGVTSCDNAGFTTDGTSLYGPALLGSTGGTKVIGDAATGVNPGDRNLAAGANEVLCFQASLPLSADNSLEAKTTTATFRFDAEQRRNNDDVVFTGPFVQGDWQISLKSLGLSGNHLTASVWCYYGGTTYCGAFEALTRSVTCQRTDGSTYDPGYSHFDYLDYSDPAPGGPDGTTYNVRIPVCASGETVKYWRGEILNRYSTGTNSISY